MSTQVINPNQLVQLAQQNNEEEPESSDAALLHLTPDLQLRINDVCAKLNWCCYSSELQTVITNKAVEYQANIVGFIEVLEAVVGMKHTRMVEVLTARSGLRWTPLHNPFDLNQVNTKNLDQILSLDWLEAKRNLFLTGPHGVGKTSMAIEAGKRAIDAGYSVFFCASSELFDEGMNSAQVNRRLKRACSARLLILDDIGFEDMFEGNTRRLRKLFEHRTKHGLSTILTGNIAVKQWMKRFDDHDMFKGTVIKFFSNTKKVTLKGANFYIELAKSLNLD